MAFRTSWSPTTAHPWLRHTLSATEGSVSVIGAFSLIAMIGAIALSVELGQGYVSLLANQRSADRAALGGATAYAANRSQTTLLATATDIANANGVGTSRPVPGAGRGPCPWTDASRPLEPRGPAGA